MHAHHQHQHHGPRQSALAEFGPRGSGFDPNTYAPSHSGHQQQHAFNHPHHYQHAVPTQHPHGAAGTQPPPPQQQLQQAAKPPRKSAPRPVRAVTAHQIIASAHAVGGAIGGAAMLDGHELGLVQIVGRVIDVASSADDPPATGGGQGGMASLTVSVTDGSGVIAGRQWDARGPDEAPIEVGGLVSVAGQLRPFPPRPGSDGVTWTVVGRVVAEPDWDRLTYHMLDAVNTTLRLTRGDPVASAPRPCANANAAGRTGRGAPPHGQHLSQPAAAAASARGPVQAPTMPPPVAVAAPPPPVVHLKAMLPEEAVAHALSGGGYDPDTGLTAQAIAAATAHAVSARLQCSEHDAADAVIAEVRRMAAIGQLFTTIDDEHFVAA